jgi:endonuclease YncB( thermonuclease family)
VKKTAIVGIALVIIVVGIFGSQFTQISKDTSQVNSPTEFEKPSETQERHSTTISAQEKSSTQSTISVNSISSKYCSGDSRCFTGMVSKVIDGDTIVVDGQSVRFALDSTPELN